MAKSLTTIWRVENVLGRGPYRKPKFGGILGELNDIGLNEYADARRPDPSVEPGIADFFNGLSRADKRCWVFGFKSLKQYRKWFNTKEVRDLLHRKGFFLTRYEVEPEKARSGEHQAVFFRRKGTVAEFRNCQGKPLEADKDLAEALAGLVKRKELTLKPGAQVPRPSARHLGHNLRRAA